MAHTPIEKLKDIEPLLQRIRALEGVREPKPAIFYIKSKPFLHFHDSDGQRWADAKDGDSWGEQIPIQFNANDSHMDRFFKQVVKRHSTLTAKKKVTPEPKMK